MKQIISLNIGDHITINNRLFRIELRPQSNGKRTWRHPTLILVRPEKERYPRRFVEDIVGNSLKDIELTEKDRPVEEFYININERGSEKQNES